MGHKGLQEPHILLASSNPQKLLRNLAGILAKGQLSKIDKAVCTESKLLYELGRSHLLFAQAISGAHWRQKVSRFYYAAYNIKRAVSLRHDGAFSTDSKDHANVETLPSSLANYATYSVKLRNLREDRNLADYSHLAKESDLIIAVSDAEVVVTDFASDAKVFLQAKGVSI